TKIDDHHLLVKLLKAGKQTVASIRKSRKFISLGDAATQADWRLVAKTYGASEEDITTLQAEAARLAYQGESPSVLTDHLIDAVRHLTDWDAEKLLAPAKQPARRTKPNSAAPEDPLEPSQQLRAGIHHLAREDAKEGKIILQQRHLHNPLRQQNLAPAVPAQSDRVAELEKQVRDLSAQLKEADKAAALIRGLQADRDRLERENRQLQQLLQENTD
ncbi:hypothetical protein, partial [Phormidium sp. CCY1219]|uniref:hypothetical protein n=1 Tax=Phormidium sp. CCY1219 TaxID=2886104 RepID=UPI002D1EA510